MDTTEEEKDWLRRISGQNLIIVKGIDKEKVGQYAAETASQAPTMCHILRQCFPKMPQEISATM